MDKHKVMHGCEVKQHDMGFDNLKKNKDLKIVLAVLYMGSYSWQH